MLKGVYKGTKPSVDRSKIKELLDEGLSPTEVVRRMNNNRVSTFSLMGRLKFAPHTKLSHAVAMPVNMNNRHD